jgi:hypothetical protein
MALHKKSKTSGDIEFFSAVLCVSLRPLRLKSPFNAEIAEIRREPQRKYSTFCAKHFLLNRIYLNHCSTSSSFELRVPPTT